MNWNSNEVRRTFLDFFKGKEHTIVPSAPMVVKDDPTLMFTNAGMNQFKDIFLGNQQPVATRISDTQKCLRVSGKHNDLEEVGVDSYHHTMFEMLGNWSFGDPARPAGGYFKDEAISWAWELLTTVYKIPIDRLYVTVFEGDEKDGLESDKEAIEIWKEHIAEDRILACNKKDNFWEMGETGPCGPCSEIHIDLRNDEERQKVDGKSLVNKDDENVIEIWNLVFIQYERMKDKQLKPLPQRHVDTGMGFERLCRVLQQKGSNYDTDVFMPLIGQLEKNTGKKYGVTKQEDIAFRVIADHVRAIAFSIADGQLPANTGAGYVIRRILRRAIRYGYSFLDVSNAVIFSLVDVLDKQFGTTFPELSAQKDLIARVIKEEEESFLKTLERGIQKFNQEVSQLDNKKEITGNFAFELYDTYGFPLDLTQLLADEKGIKVDIKGFESCLEEQKNRSKNAAVVDTQDWVVLKDEGQQEFIGYDNTSTELNIVKYRQIESKGKKQFQLVFNVTPFYAESGGQVGDTGFIEADGKKIYITNTKKENQLTVHFTDNLPANLDSTFRAEVNAAKRALTNNNHSATHLLHYALRAVLGDHVQQKGSLVNANNLRFDFSHFQKVSDEEILQVEQLVNRQIRANIKLEEHRSTPIAAAKEMGAMALFGEKYGDLVRVIKFGNSVELCGGTHVDATGQIGFFKILSESSISAGIRRIEAVTADAAELFVNDQIDILKELKGQLKNPKNITTAVSDLLEQNAKLQKKIEHLNKEKAGSLGKDLMNSIVEVNGVKFIAQKVDVEVGVVKDIAFKLKQQDDIFAVLGTEANGKANLSIAISDNLVKNGWHAGNIVRELAKEIQGGGGGQAAFATAGGKNPAGLAGALERAKEFIK